MSIVPKSLTSRLCFGAFLLLVLACGGGGGSDPADRILLDLRNGGSSTTTLAPSTDYILKLSVASPDSSLNLDIDFGHEAAHFDVINPVNVIIPKGSTVTVDVPVRTKAVTGVTGEIEPTIDGKTNLTVVPLTYSIN